MSELVTIEKINSVEVFVDRGLEPYLDRIEQEARSLAAGLDISSEQGRKEIASLAYRVARSKTALDDLGKNLTEEWKTKSKAVDAERKRMRERLDALKDEVRASLTEWEGKEKARVERHEADIAEIANGGNSTLQNWQSLSVEVMRDGLKGIEVVGTKDWEEFQARGKYAVDAAAAAITAAIEKRERYDAEQAELARLRQEKEERERKEREDRIAAEAAARAKAEAEAESRRKERAAEEARLVLVREKEAADRRAQEAEAAKNASEERAERDRHTAAEKAKRDAEAAAQAERDSMERQKQAEAEATATREADKKHRAKVNNEALNALLGVIFSDDPAVMTEYQKNTGKQVIEAIAKGLIPHVKIAY